MADKRDIKIFLFFFLRKYVVTHDLKVSQKCMLKWPKSTIL